MIWHSRYQGQGRHREGEAWFIRSLGEVCELKVPYLALDYLVENKEVLILQAIEMVDSVCEDQLLCLFDFYCLTILEFGPRNRESAYLTRISGSRNSQYSRSFSDSASVGIVYYDEIFDKYIFSSSYSVKIVENIVDQCLIPDRDVALLREEIEHFLVFEHCHILVVIVAHCDLARVLNLHRYQLRIYYSDEVMNTLNSYWLNFRSSYFAC